MALFADAARDSAATFTRRVVEVSQRALLIRIGRTTEVVDLACRVVPELLRAGTHPQAWIALRHIADLLGQLGDPDLGIVILDSANAAAGAAAVVGEAVQVEAALRASLVERPARSRDTAPEPMSIGRLWDTVEPALQMRGSNRCIDRSLTADRVPQSGAESGGTT